MDDTNGYKVQIFPLQFSKWNFQFWFSVCILYTVAQQSSPVEGRTQERSWLKTVRLLHTREIHTKQPPCKRGREPTHTLHTGHKVANLVHCADCYALSINDDNFPDFDTKSIGQQYPGILFTATPGAHIIGLLVLGLF